VNAHGFSTICVCCASLTAFNGVLCMPWQEICSSTMLGMQLIPCQLHAEVDRRNMHNAHILNNSSTPVARPLWSYTSAKFKPVGRLLKASPAICCVDRLTQKGTLRPRTRLKHPRQTVHWWKSIMQCMTCIRLDQPHAGSQTSPAACRQC
jgi:hypothetical protein